MQAYKADRVVGVLTWAVSFTYYVFWVGALIVLIGLPAAALLGADPMEMAASVPVTVPQVDATLVSAWDPAVGALELDEVTAVLKLPYPLLPTWLRVVTWAGNALAVGLILLFLHHLRRLFRRVRAGSPFEPENARHLLWMGMLLLGYHLFESVFFFWVAAVVTRTLEPGSSLELGASLHIDAVVVFIALVLIALAEIFRRGAALEDEQSLVV
jgi:hypothetical protein